MMKPTSFEDAIRLQFATLMKKVIDNGSVFPVFDEYDLDVADYDVYSMTACVCDKDLCDVRSVIRKKTKHYIVILFS